jgi:hypothetical protein
VPETRVGTTDLDGFERGAIDLAADVVEPPEHDRERVGDLMQGPSEVSFGGRGHHGHGLGTLLLFHGNHTITVGYHPPGDSSA